MKFHMPTLQKARQHLHNRYIQNGGDYMYNYNIGDDVTKQVLSLQSENTKKKKVDDLLNSISKINNTFETTSGTTVPENVSFERKTFSPKSENDLQTEAQAGLSDYKATSEKGIRDANQSKQTALFENLQTLGNENKESKQELAGLYDTAKQNASDEALKRGLSRSSIVVNQLAAFDQDQINKFNEMNQAYSEKRSAIEFELSGLESELSEALNNFDVMYAVKLQDEMNELNKALKQEEDAILEYNNEIALQEAKFNKELAELQNELKNADFEKGTDMLAIYGKYGSNIVGKYLQDTVYNSTKAYLNTLTREEALDVLNDESVKQALGSLAETLRKEFGA